MKEALKEFDLQADREYISRSVSTIDTSFSIRDCLCIFDNCRANKFIMMISIQWRHEYLDVFSQELLFSKIPKYSACREVNIGNLSQSIVFST
jgi:hypothetical protein